MNRQILYDRYPNEDIVFLEGNLYDDAILGVARDDKVLRVIYSEVILIEILSADMDYMDAVEYYFNIAGSYLGPGTPIYMEDLPDDLDFN